MPLFLRSLALALVLASLNSCSPKAEDEGGPVAMSFTVVDALLGPAATLPESSLSIRPPKGWSALDSTRVAALSVPVGPTFHLRPRLVFMDSLSGCVLIVSSWATDSTWSWSQLEKRQKQEVDQAGKGRSVRHDSFILAGQSCLQSMVQDSVVVNFKLLLAKGIQLDYVVPGPEYTRQAERIESSLGSLTFTDGSTQTQE